MAQEEKAPLLPDCYQVWIDRDDGRIYAVRLCFASRRRLLRVTGVCGPLDPLSPLSAADLASYDYQAGTVCEALMARRQEFQVLLPRATPHHATARKASKRGAAASLPSGGRGGAGGAALMVPRGDRTKLPRETRHQGPREPVTR